MSDHVLEGNTPDMTVGTSIHDSWYIALRGTHFDALPPSPVSVSGERRGQQRRQRVQLVLVDQVGHAAAQLPHHVLVRRPQHQAAVVLAEEGRLQVHQAVQVGEKLA